MLCWILIAGGLLIIMGQRDRSEEQRQNWNTVLDVRGSNSNRPVELVLRRDRNSNPRPGMVLGAAEGRRLREFAARYSKFRGLLRAAAERAGGFPHGTDNPLLLKFLTLVLDQLANVSSPQVQKQNRKMVPDQVSGSTWNPARDRT
jgi:hypothetical protein